jgi:hypothetical protein
MVKIDGLPDEDADGLSDLAEIALGTSSAKRDTDSDGMSDLAEITAGLDPLGGRALPTGIIATLPLQGQAKAVTLEGSTTSAETQTAYVATGSYGLAIVDASRFQRPLVLGQIDLSGDAVDVAVDSRLGIAAVAAGSALHLVDVSDATAPVRTQTINIPAVQVEAANGVAYVAAGNGIESYSLLTGELLQVLPIGSSAIVSLARDGSMLYAVDAASTLRAIDISGLAMRARGELALPAAGGRIFVGNGIAYIGASSGVIGGFTAGFTTADVGDPDAMHVLSGPDMFNLQGYAVTANGSGLGLLAGTLIGASGALSRIDVVDVRDPTRTDQFLTSFNLSAPPFDVAIGAGIAFVADGTGGLQVANYLPFDNKGRAPTITLSAPTADLDAGTPGIQALEGSLINVKLDVNDDQQVRNVELLVDGRVVANDVSFPWSAAVALPTLAAATTATIQASATDTGGNTTLSDALVIELVPDTFAPTIVTSNVKDGSRHAQTFRTVRLSFDEALDVIGITAEHFRLLDVSDNVILPTDVALSANGQLVTLTLPTLAQGSYRLVIDGDQVSDRAGNPFGSAGQIVSTFDIVEATIEWAAPAGGDWNNAANWDLGRIPDATDVVLINGGLGTTVNINAGNVRVQGIDSFSDLTLNGASLTVDSFLTVHDAYDLTLNDGVIQRGTITLEGSANLMVASGTRNSRLDGVTVVGDIDLVNATLRLKDVAIDGRVSLSNGGYSGYSTLAFEGTQTLAGNAEIVSNFDGYYNSNYLEMQAAGELTLGADVRVHGSSLVLGGSLAFNASMERLINQGTIEAATGSVQVVADAFTNEGVAEATGGTLYLSAADNAQTTSGRLRVTSGELYTSGDWALPGVIETSGGALYLGGTLHTGGFAGFVSTGGVVNFTGTVENSGSTLTLGAMPGDWVLNGTIHGGTLQIDAGESLMVASGTRNSRLDGVTVVGDIDLVNATLRLKDVAIDGRVSLSNGGYSGYSTLAFEGTQTLAGNAEIVSNFDGYYNSNYLEMQAAGELTLGADVRVHGSSLVLGGSLAFNASMERLINQGTIEAATGSVQVVADAFTNEGVAEATGGTLYLSAADNAQTTSGRLRVTSGELYTSGDWALPGVIETSGGALYLGGTLHTGGFAGFVSTGGVVNFTGTVENSGSTLTLGAMPGDWVLNGTIHGGTLQIDAGESLMVASGTRNSRLDGVTVVGDIDLVNATLRLKDMAIDGRVSLSNGGYSGYSTLAFEGTQTLAGNAEIVSNFDGYYNSNYLEMQAAGELTLGADVRVHGSSLVLGGSLAFNASMERLINQGTIEAATGSVQVVADAFTNEGVAEATGGTLYLSAADNAQTTSGRLRVTSGELYTSGDWALPGVIETSGGALYLGGTLHTGGFAGFVSTGGVVNFTGTVENSGSTLTLGAMPGDWVLNGTIHGGTLQIDAGESLMVASGTRNSRLDGVTVVGDIDLVNATLRLKDVAIDGRVSLSNGGYSGYSTLAFEGTQTLAGNAEIVSNFDGYYNSNYLEMQAAGELTLGADVRVHGSSLVLGGSLAFNASMERLINQGTIEAATGSVQVVADAFTNEGVAEATGGTLYLSAADNAQTTSGRLRVTSGELYTSGDWALPGVIETSGGALYLGGTLHTGGFAGFVSTGGVVNFTGTVENSGSTLTLGAMPGDWVLNGTIHGGTLQIDAGESLMVASGTRNSRLDGVTVVGDIDLVNATLRLKDMAIDGRVSLSNGGYSGYSTLAFEGTQTLAGNAEIVSNFDGYYNSNYLEMQAAGELTLGADVRVHGSSLVLGGSLAFNASMERLINQGTIEAATGSVQVVADAFTNEGVAEATGGTLYLSAADNAQTTSGRLRVTSGELYTSGDWALPGVIETSGGALYLGGTLHTGGFAGFVSTGGVVNFTGTVENSGSTLTLGAMPGDWVLNGTIHGGTLQIDAGESLMVASGTRNSRLDGVTVVGDIDLVNATLRLKDVAIDGRVSLSNGGYSGYSTLAFEGTQTLAGNAEIVSNFDGYYNSNYLEMQAAGELTLGADVRVHGSSLVLGGSLAFNASMERLINQGTIEAATGSVQVVADAFTNEGVAEATGGTLYLSAADNAQTTSGRLRVTSGELYTSGDWALPGVIETSGGALYLGGTLHTGGFAGFVSTGGVVNFTGTVENSGSTLTLGAMPGDWVLNGTIHGGTLQIDAGESLMVASGTRNSRLDGVTVVGDIDLVNATLRLKDVAIDGRVSLSNGGYSGYSTLAFEGTQTLAGNAEIVSNFDGYYNSNYLEMQAAGELTLGADVRVHGSSLVLGGSLAFNASMERLINQGTIEAATGSVQVVADAFTNEGVAEATGGTLYLSAADNAQTTSGRLRVTSGELYTSGDWALPGVIETSGGALYLGGTLHTGGFAGFVSTGGVVNFTGTVENSGSTLTLGAMPGDWVLNGTIHGGTLQIDAGESLMVASGTRNSRLDGVTVVGDIDLVNATLRLKDMAIDGRVSLSNGGYSGYSTLAFEGTQTLAGNAEIVSNFDGYYNSNYLEMQAAGELTLGADVRVHGSSLVLGGSLAFNASMERLINQGTIEAATGSVQVVADAFTNEGVAEATGGTLYLSAADNAQTTSGRLRVTSGELYTSGDWALPGVIETSGGALYLGGTLHTGGFAGFVSTGGVVNFTGTVENSGSTLTLGAMPGDWVLNGTIHGGTLQIDAGESLMVASGTRNSRLDGVTVVGDIDLVNATLRLKDVAIDGRVSLSNGGYSGYSTLAFEGTQTLAGNAEIVSNFDGYYNSNYLEMQAAGELTLGADVRVHGSSLVLGGSLAFNASMERLINQGTIEAATGSVQVVADAFTNEGVAEATGGTLNVGGTSFTNTGSVEAAGGNVTISSTTVNNAAAMHVAEGAVIQLSGTVTMASTSLVEVVLGGTLASEFGRFSSSGSLVLDGMVRVSLSGGFVPSLGDEFAFLTYNARTGQFVGVDDADGTPGVGYNLTYGPIDAAITAVPG